MLWLNGQLHATKRDESMRLFMQNKYREGNKDIKPNTLSYTTIINACTFPKHGVDEKESIRIAFSLFKQITSI